MRKTGYKATLAALILALTAASCGQSPAPLEKVDNNTAFEAKDAVSEENTTESPVTEDKAVREKATVETADRTSSESSESGSSDSAATAYMTALRESLTEYREASGAVITAFDEKNYNNALEPAEKMVEALNGMKNIAAPSEFSDLHHKLCDSIDKELRYAVDCVEFAKMSAELENMSESELVAYKALVEQMNEDVTASDFAQVLLETIKTVKASTE